MSEQVRSEPVQKTPGVRSLLLAFLLAGLAFAGLSQAVRLLGEQVQSGSVYALILKGETLLLDASTLDALNHDLRRFTSEEQQQLAQVMSDWNQQQLDRLFALPEAGVERYLDWYYSMPGSYIRLYHALKGDLPQQLEKQLHQRVFEDTGFALQLDMLGQAYTARFQQELQLQQAQRLEQLQEQLHRDYSVRQMPLTDQQQAAVEPAFVLQLDQALLPDFSASEMDFQRWKHSAGLSASAGAGLLLLPAARIATQRMMQSVGVRTATRITLQYLARLTPRLAAALTASGTATAAASPSGPGALVAGLTTLTLFVVSDWALLKAEEAIYRDDKAAALYAGLQEWREELSETLQQATAPLFAERQEFLRQRLNRPYLEAGVEQRFYLFPDQDGSIERR